MPIPNIPSVSGSNVDELVEAIEMQRKELHYLLSTLDTDNITRIDFDKITVGGNVPVKSLIENTSSVGTVERWKKQDIPTVVNEDFFGKTIPVQAFTGNGNHMIIHDDIEIDPSKTYEITIWFKSSAITGTDYFGLYAYDENGTKVNVDKIDSNGNVASTTNNPYFWIGDNEPTWKKRTAYLFPSGASANEMKGYGENVTENIRLPSNAKKVRVRWLNHYNAGVTKTVYAANMTMTEVASGVSGKVARKTTLIDETGIYTGSLTADQIVTGTLDASLVTLASSATGGTMLLDGDGFTIKDSAGKVRVSIDITNQNWGASDPSSMRFLLEDETLAGLVGTNSQGNFYVGTNMAANARLLLSAQGTSGQVEIHGPGAFVHVKNKEMVFNVGATSLKHVVIDDEGTYGGYTEPTIRPSADVFGYLGTSAYGWYQVYTKEIFSLTTGNRSSKKDKHDIKALDGKVYKTKDGREKDVLTALEELKTYHYKRKIKDKETEQLGLILEDGELPEDLVTENGEAIDLYSYITFVAEAVKALIKKEKLK